MRTETDNIKPMSVFVIKKYNNNKKKWQYSTQQEVT
jgi:hypothetical protein